MEVKPAGGVFTPLAVVSFEPFEAEPLRGGSATKVVLTGKSGTLVRGVQAIRFTAGRVPTSVDGAFVWREVDVSGVSASAPSRR